MPGNLYEYFEEKANPSIIRINGERVEQAVKDGYLVLERNWKEDEIVLEIPKLVESRIDKMKVWIPFDKK